MRRLSGNAYVSCYDRWRPTQKRRGVIEVAGKRATCEHKHTICVHCADSWNWDYKLFLHRTGAGRRMAERLWEAGVDMSQFDGYISTGGRKSF